MDSSTLTTGTGVSEWRDKSGLGQAFSQATTGSQPTLTASAISGRPGVTFSSGRLLNLGSQTIGGNNLVSAPGNPWSIYIVCRSTDNSALVKTLFSKGQNQVQLAQNTAGSLVQASGASPSAAPAFPANVNALFSFDYNGSFVQMRINDGISNTATPTNTINEAVNIALGMRNASSPGQHFVGHIGEVIFYNRSLSAAERSSVVNYLSSKWGFAIPQYSPPTYADADANAYITRVEFADTLALETATRDAINNFIVGCKADGIWSNIKASCILAGARTLSGALTPLAGTAPTNNFFVSADYNRKTGLVGNGSTKYLDTNRANNADPQDSNHNAVFVTTANTSGTRGYIGSGAGGVGTNQIFTDGGNTTFRSRWGSFGNSRSGTPTGLVAHARTVSIPPTIIMRQSGSTTTASFDSETPSSANLRLLMLGSAGFNGDGRLSFYSIGEHLDLALLDSRVTTLYNAISTAIVPQVANADAQDWLNRVYDNGGTVSATTAAAVNTFCNSIDADGIRDRFYRLNLFCGSSLLSALVPLYRAESLASAVRGNATDSNANFVAADYAETGSSGGLTGGSLAAAKHLVTGLPTNAISGGNVHASIYASNVPVVDFNNPNATAIGWGSPDGRNVQLRNLKLNTNPQSTTLYAEPRGGVSLSFSSASPTGLVLGSSESTSLRRLYIAGSQVVENTTSDSTASVPVTGGYYVFAVNGNGTASAFHGGRLGAYSVGLSLSPSQVTAYNAAMQQFQTALARNA